MARGKMKRKGGNRGGGDRYKKRTKKHESTKPKKSDYESRKRLKREVSKIVNTPAVEPEVSSDDEPETVDNYKELLSMMACDSQQSRYAATVSDDDDSSSCESDNNEKPAQDHSDVEDNAADPVKDEQDEEEEFEEVDDTQHEELEAEDPFAKHIQWELSPGLLAAVSNEEKATETKSVSWPALGRLLIEIPKPQNTLSEKKITTLQDDITYAPLGSEPKRCERLEWNKLHVKQRIQDNVMKINQEGLSALQCELFSIMNNYQDIYYHERNHKNGEEIRFAYCLHAVNHVVKTRTKVLHHNARLLKKSDVPDEYRDQGLVRPKVLIILPFKEAAVRTVNLLASILLGTTKGTVMNYKRFTEEFAGAELAMPRRNPKPEDYEQTFAGNTDDNFRIGITVTKKCIKLYADFYVSDIIIASPLGLRMIVGAEGEEGRDYDFLASIELLIADQADIFLQQNWDHVLHIWDHLHKQPREAHGADFSRLRPWALAGHAKYYRQTLLFSAVPLPELQAVINRRCHNYAGCVKVANPITVGSICQVILQMPQVFHRVDAQSPTEVLSSRFEMFKTKILPQFMEGLMSHTLIFVSSYFDYVRIRNHFKREDTSFVQICEYSKDGKIARARDMFFHNDAHFLLYSERFHFFRRMRIKGIRHLLFYQPPCYPMFYSEMCNFMQEINQNPREGGGTETNMSVTVLYSKYDAQRLAGIVGSERASRMLTSDRKVHMMVTGD